MTTEQIFLAIVIGGPLLALAVIGVWVGLIDLKAKLDRVTLNDQFGTYDRRIASVAKAGSRKSQR